MFAMGQVRYWLFVIGAMLVLFLIDRIVRVLGRMAIAVIDQTRQGQLTRLLMENDINCRLCSMSGDQ